MGKGGIKTAAQNRKAYHDYFVEEKLEAGISLAGTEVKSIRMARLNLKDAYCSVKNGEMILLEKNFAFMVSAGIALVILILIFVLVCVIFKRKKKKSR